MTLERTDLANEEHKALTGSLSFVDNDPEAIRALPDPPEPEDDTDDC